jgi:uncharacterized protein YbjQ (UPF0145 family)
MSQLICISILFALGYFVGGGRNRLHLRRLDKRERELQGLTTTTGIIIPRHAALSDPTLVHGGVVISVDYFKRFIGRFHTIIGGRVRTYESLMIRGRREAVIRMKQAAKARGADAVINVRIETTRMANGRGDKQTAGIEVLAYGTAVRTA